ncbi:DNA mismatch repair endonuclease MutL [Caldisalinibacter kiritimatiensis]|uniref:DNA mismatch repair protein MutL n=1 Tax=Caldisalinibacter kiritimatiensis TaxID=1304284 RepID=R1AV55_9FIRM|nr:DNA mismatch repair endonuclease MutL [Caldisalinibacter kiritimatiensis]EOD01048.1 DNA mismatch repair protein MutL [Caldisalinibacter kiritimatiensis]
MRSRIQILDNNTINKIAAGEVVERPASVVKELVENSIDAQATSISIEIVNGGKKYIRVTDNGTGIINDDIKLAFLRHSTSKIKKVEDLERITSLGFRGEALASIASVAQVQLLSKTKDSLSGRQVDVHGGEIISNKEVGCPKGTTVIVKNLFYNTPVRKKFLKSDNAESSHISETIYRLALGNPNIAFKYIKDNKLILKTPGNGDIYSTIYSLYGKEFADSLIKINYNGDDIKIDGYIAKPSYTRGNRNFQYFYVNGRFIKSRLLSKTLENEYKSLIPINKYPVCILYIDTNAKNIDANVHPTKIEIRFKNESILKYILSKSIKVALEEKNLIPSVTINSKDKKEEVKQQKIIDLIEDTDVNSKPSDDNLLVIEDHTKDNIDFMNSTDVVQDRSSINYSADTIESVEYTNNKSQIKDKQSKFVKNIIDNTGLSNSNIPINAIEKKQQTSIKKIPDMKIIGILFGTYILAEDSNDEVFYIIDQHAAHERIMYEKYKKEFENQTVTIQELLAPEIINLTHSEYQVVKDNIDIFNKLGFRIEGFGTNSVIIRSVPMLFGKPKSKQLFMDILDKIQDNIKNSYQLRIEKIMKMACTSAIKAGDKIENIEIERLLKDLRKADNPYTCPHGRPVIIKMSKYEIEKKFKRIQ